MHEQHQLAASSIFSPWLVSVNINTSKTTDADEPKQGVEMVTPNSSRRLLFHASASTSLSVLLNLASPSIRAQSLPPQLRVLCTGPAGSIPDIIARRITEQIAVHYPQGAIVDNKPGAAGQIAVAALKAAPPDGSTMLLAQGALTTIYPYLYPKLAYDPDRDLQPVSLAGEMTLAWAIGPAVPANITRVPDLIVWMRNNPRLANVGSPGQGTLPHLLQAMLLQQAGVEWQHVVYPGGPQAIVDLLGGQIAALALPEGLLRQQKESGKIRVLATSGSSRSTIFPEIPTFTELGYKGLEIREWFAFFMPDKSSAAILATASRQIVSAVVRPQIIAAFGDTAIAPATSSPAELSLRIAAEQKQWKAILQATGIKASQ
jgi:tripartite-type tricarboxylate transporter receptor subunit TctC